MSDTSQSPDPLSRTVFPFPKLGGNTNNPAQTTEASAQEYFQALSQAEDGFFPIGYNGQWHGGIHFGEQTGEVLAQDAGIRCLADGEVIAYRIDEEYPTVKYESCAPATYSRGFVLVRHRLQLPAAPQANIQSNDSGGSEGAGTPTGNEPSLLFYSLYMHLLNSEAYEADATLARPGFWENSNYLVGERASDTRTAEDSSGTASSTTGMNIRDARNRLAGFAPRGVKLKLGAPNPARSAYYEITEVVEGTTSPDDVVGMYVYKGTSDSREGLEQISTPHTTGTTYIPPDPISIKGGDLIGHLGQYQRHMDMDALAKCASGRPLAQVDVFTHEDLQGFIRQSRARDAQLEARQKTLLHIKPGARLVQPSDPDIVLSSDEAVVVTGGDSDGLWAKGQRGTVAIVDERPPGFSSATRAYGEGRIFLAAVDTNGNELTLEQFNALPDRSTHPRRKLLTPVGNEIWVDRSSANNQSVVTAPARAWSDFPLQVANAAGEAAAHARVLPVSTIEQSTKENDDVRWFQVDAGTVSGGEVSGWVRESGHANVELCSPWAWPGFELFDVGELEPRELFARELANSRRAQPQEQEEFEGAARSIEQSPLFDALGRAIDSDGNQRITPLELRKAMGRSWLAQAISRLVIRYPSEWSDPTDRWSRIDDLIENEVLRKDWEHEKGRIGDLIIWPEVAGQHDFPSSSTVHHFHPVGFVDNFLRGRNVTTYRIHHNGLIEKALPDEKNETSLLDAHYIYVNASGEEHDFGLFKGTKATRWIRKNSIGTEDIYLIEASSLEERSGGAFGFGFTGTQRRHLSQPALASLIGALMDVGYQDVVSTGFSMEDGSPGVSSSHINGENGDFRFLRLDKSETTPTHLNTSTGVLALDEARQGEFNNALYKFGWKSQLAWRYEKKGEKRLLPRTTHYHGHHHHLHVGGYSPNLVEVEQ